ncbi:MAG TPA: hypothetical protein VHM20_06450 [Gammaproteobacteria bacterium]|jgi:hypothetical protein|nr:hypothetical protein [Gammaproteobacteria bacterium]
MKANRKKSIRRDRRKAKQSRWNRVGKSSSTKIGHGTSLYLVKGKRFKIKKRKPDGKGSLNLKKGSKPFVRLSDVCDLAIFIFKN